MKVIIFLSIKFNLEILISSIFSLYSITYIYVDRMLGKYIDELNL